jgi:hypothetical protein
MRNNNEKRSTGHNMREKAVRWPEGVERGREGKRDGGKIKSCTCKQGELPRSDVKQTEQ